MQISFYIFDEKIPTISAVGGYTTGFNFWSYGGYNIISILKICQITIMVRMDTSIRLVKDETQLEWLRVYLHAKVTVTRLRHLCVSRECRFAPLAMDNMVICVPAPIELHNRTTRIK